MSLYLVKPPQGLKFNPMSAEGLVANLVDRLAEPQIPLELAIEASGGRVNFVIRNWRKDEIKPEVVHSLISPFYPEVQLDDYLPVALNFPAKTRVIAFKRAYDIFPEAVQLPVTQIRENTDPLVALTQAMGSLEPGEYMDYVIVVFEKTRLKRPFWASVAMGMIEQYQRQNDAVRFQIEKMKADKRPEMKRKKEIIQVGVFMKMTTPNPERFHLLNTLASSLRFMADDLYPIFDDYIAIDFDTPDVREFGRAEWATALDRMKPSDISKLDFVLLPEELAAMWHLPHSGFAQVRVGYLTAFPKQLEVSEPSPDYARIGIPEESRAQVAIYRADRRYHAYITGKTGMGKSTMLHNTIEEDIYNAEGVAVIDPHGSLVDDILKCSIPPERVDDVVLLECGDTDYPVPLNPFRIPPGVDEIAVFNTVLWMIKSIYSDSWSETRMETTFRNILQVVLSDPNATPLDIQEAIMNPNFRRRLVSDQTKQGKLSRASRNWWRAFDDASASEQRSQTQSVLNRLTAFLGSPHIERMTCHPQTIDFRALIRDKKIVLVKLAGDAIKTEVGSLGAIFLAQFYLSSLSLGALPGEALPRFYLYVDETQRFITTALPEMFSEARKFGLSLTLANQYLGQLDDETREGILKNVGTKISFECHPDEASLTGRMYEPDIERSRLTNLGVGKAAIRTSYKGQTLPAFVVRGYNPVDALENPPDLAHIRQKTREYLGMIKAQEVDAWIEKRYESDLFKKPPVEVDLVDIDTD